MKADEFYMRRALEVGERARLISTPNPWVGCVLVKDNQIISEGHTQPPGQLHAEVVALQNAKGTAAGSIAYVTLEPCAHYGRTPPCTNALIEAKVKKVVIALEDPDPLVSGKGIALLKQAGIEVEVGLCAKEAEASLRPYLHHRKTGKAYCLIKMAVSADGRVAAPDGTSQWITGAEARKDAHYLRACSQAIMIGSGTALKDLPALTVRHAPTPRQPPLRILFDRRGRVPAKGPLFDDKSASTLVITAKDCPAARILEWEKSGARVLLTEKEAPFDSILSNLGSMDIIQLMIEGGAELQTAIVHQRECQELIFYTGPLLMGANSLPSIGDIGVANISDAVKLTLNQVQKLGDSARLDYFLT